VPGVVNPADIGTRPISITEFRDCQAWWQGPEFLRSDVTEWPKTKIVQELESKELKQTIFLTTDHLKKVDFDFFGQLHPRYFSVFETLQRPWKMSHQMGTHPQSQATFHHEKRRLANSPIKISLTCRC
jgi:hypothetical protein